MTTHNLFAPPKKHLRWADAAFAELNDVLVSFGRGAKHESVTEFDTETGEYVYKVRLLTELPDSVARKATEVLLHSRHSFDQSLHAVISALGRSFKGTAHYPWASSPTDLEGRIKGLQAKIKGDPIGGELWKVIREQEPYGASDAYAGGDDLIRDLSKVANSKHDIGVGIVGAATAAKIPNIGFQAVSELKYLVPIWDPVKQEVPLMRVRNPQEFYMHGDYKLTIQIIISDARLRRPVRVLGALDRFRVFAKRVLQDFEGLVT